VREADWAKVAADVKQSLEKEHGKFADEEAGWYQEDKNYEVPVLNPPSSAA